MRLKTSITPSADMFSIRVRPEAASSTVGGESGYAAWGASSSGNSAALERMQRTAELTAALCWPFNPLSRRLAGVHSGVRLIVRSPPHAWTPATSGGDGGSGDDGGIGGGGDDGGVPCSAIVSATRTSGCPAAEAAGSRAVEELGDAVPEAPASTAVAFSAAILAAPKTSCTCISSTMEAASSHSSAVTAPPFTCSVAAVTTPSSDRSRQMTAFARSAASPPVVGTTVAAAAQLTARSCLRTAATRSAAPTLPAASTTAGATPWADCNSSMMQMALAHSSRSLSLACLSVICCRPPRLTARRSSVVAEVRPADPALSSVDTNERTFRSRSTTTAARVAVATCSELNGPRCAEVLPVTQRQRRFHCTVVIRKWNCRGTTAVARTLGSIRVKLSAEASCNCPESIWVELQAARAA